MSGPTTMNLEELTTMLGDLSDNTKSHLLDIDNALKLAAKIMELQKDAIKQHEQRIKQLELRLDNLGRLRLS